MKKTLRLFSSLVVMTIMFLGVSSKINAVEIPQSVTLTGSTPMANGYNLFTVEPSGGTHAYCLDINNPAPSYGSTMSIFDLNQVFGQATVNKMVAVIRASEDPNYNFGLSEIDSFYVTQAALWYAEKGSTPMHETLRNSSYYGDAYNKLLNAIEQANNGTDFTKGSGSISIGANGALTNSMHEVNIGGKKYLLSDSEFVVSAPGNYTVTVEGGYLADKNGNTALNSVASLSTNDSFKIIIPIGDEEKGNVSANFSVITNEAYVLGYQLHGYQSITTSGLQRLALLFTNRDHLSTNYSVSGSYENQKKSDIKIAKVNKENKLIAGAKLGIYKKSSDSNEVLVGSYDSTTDYITVSLGQGEYVLKEISAPKGYLLNPNGIEFSIDDKGNLVSGGKTVSNKTLTIVNELPKIKIRKVNENKVDIKGAEIVICNYDSETKKESNCNYKWTTDGTVKELTIGVDFGSIEDGSYIIKELSAPRGYEISAPKVITVKDGKIFGDLQKDTVVIVDKSYVDVSKTDATGQKEIAGAHMRLFNRKGELVEEWTSEVKSHRVSGLVIGETYEIVEELAPKGYVPLSTSIKFRITDEGKVETLNCETAGDNNSEVGSAISCSVMSSEDILKIKNDVTKLKISKIDVTNKEELPGATLKILNMDGTPVYQDGKILEWVSTNEPHYIEMLPVGKYRLVETIVPEGYAATTNEIQFEVKAESGIQTVVFENDVTKVLISKKDFTTGKEIEGATLQILNADGTPLYQNGELVKWVSTAEPHYIERLPIGKYILVEVLPANGYQGDMVVDGMVTSKYEFEIKDNTILKIDVYNKIMDTPNTGLDVSGTYVIGSIVMLFGIGTIAISRRKNEI